jgi:predicted O-methyltransferase YrrM
MSENFLQIGSVDLDRATACVLEELGARAEAETAIAASLPPGQMEIRREEFLLPVGAAAGTLLHLLIRGSQARRVLELGTSYGYSTLWLAHAVRATGGHVVSIDLSSHKQQYARALLSRCGLDGYVSFHAREAVDFLTADRSSYDFVLLDLWKDLYIPCLDALLSRLEAGATVVADNLIEPPIARSSASKYLAHLDRIDDLRTVVLPVGNGLGVSRYKVSTPEAATLWHGRSL